MLLADGVYSIVASTSVEYCCVSNERLIFRLILKYFDRNVPLRKQKFDDCNIILSL